MKKIAIFVAYFYPHLGGLEKYVYNLFGDQKSLDVTIITANTENVKSYEELNGFKVHRLPCLQIMGNAYPILKPSSLRVLIDLGAFDYVVTQTRFFTLSIAGALFATRKGIPLIHFEHGTDHVPWKNPVIKTLMACYDHIFGNYIIRHSVKAIGCCMASARFIRHLCNDVKEIEVIRNGVASCSFEKRENNLRQDLGIESGKVLLFVGRLVYSKGVQDLIGAIWNMNDVKLIVVGDGGYMATLRNLCKNNGNIIFVGKKSDDEIIDYMSIADLFVNPSYAEGLPTSVLEAGAMGMPIVATDVGGTREIIEDGYNGLLVEPRDVEGLRRKLILLLEDEGLRQKLSRNIRKRVLDEFGWDESRRKLRELLQ